MVREFPYIPSKRWCLPDFGSPLTARMNPDLIRITKLDAFVSISWICSRWSPLNHHVGSISGIWCVLVFQPFKANLRFVARLAFTGNSPRWISQTDYEWMACQKPQVATTDNWRRMWVYELSILWKIPKVDLDFCFFLGRKTHTFTFISIKCLIMVVGLLFYIKFPTTWFLATTRKTNSMGNLALVSKLLKPQKYGPMTYRWC